MADPVIDISQVSRRFRATKALDDVSLTLARGGVYRSEEHTSELQSPC